VTAIGFEVTADRLNDLLVLLSVLMIEAGGGLSLALGMVLGAAPAGCAQTRLDTPAGQPEQPKTPSVDALDALPDAPTVQPSTLSRRPRPASVIHAGDLAAWLRAEQPKTLPVDALDALSDAATIQPSTLSRQLRPASVHACDLAAWLRGKGGTAQTSMRRLGRELGRSPAGVHVEVRRLAAAGVLMAVTGPRGTVLTLTGAGRPN
jgi:hypothetical protein